MTAYLCSVDFQNSRHFGEWRGTYSGINDVWAAAKLKMLEDRMEIIERRLGCSCDDDASGVTAAELLTI